MDFQPNSTATNVSEAGNEKDKIEAYSNVCGIIMPISEASGYTTSHWTEVLQIISDAILEAGFRPNLVSEAEESSIIHKTIVQNIYSNEVVVCDVSSRNPNVMLELGMRLAFDKAVVVVKDDETKYMFDATPLKYIQYPRHLRYSDINLFKRRLTSAIRATASAQRQEDYNSFLKAFGQFKTAVIDSKEASVAEMLQDMSSKLETLASRANKSDPLSSQQQKIIVTLRKPANEQSITVIQREMKKHFHPLLDIETNIDEEFITFLVEGNFSQHNAGMVREMMVKKLSSIDPNAAIYAS